MKRKFTVNASSQVSTKQEATKVLEQMKNLYNVIDSCSKETYDTFVPSWFLEELDIAIHEMRLDIERVWR